MEALARIPVQQGTEAYARLRAEVRAAGILKRSYVYYAILIPVVFGGYLLSAAAIVVLQGFAWLALACLAFSFFSVQIGGLMHDAGHRAVFKSARLNNILGNTCSALIGMVFDNWRSRHNAHHATSNQEGKDPDLEIPMIATTARLYAAKSPLQRFFARYQAYYYYPLGAIVSFSNRFGTLSYFRGRGSLLDLGRFLIYLPAVICLFIVPFVIFSPLKAIFVVSFVHVLSGIYLANCFAPNHKGMPVVPADEEMSFIEQQVVTSRNVRGGFLTDVYLVGLNHQIEHHLFPSCPRNKLPLLRPYVQKACRDLGLPYVEASLIQTNRDIWNRLRAAPIAARLLRPVKTGA